MTKRTFLWRGLLVITLIGAFLSLKPLTSQAKSVNLYQEDKKTKTLTWGVKADTNLFGLMNIKNSRIEGFDVDMAKALTQQIYGKNAKAKFIQVTADTKIPLLKNGNLDAVIAVMTITPERAKIVDFSQPYFAAGQSLLVKKGSAIQNVKDLNDKTVLAVKGTTTEADIKKVAPQAKVLQYGDYAQAFVALQSGQGQAMAADNGILYGLAKENQNYRVTGGTFTAAPYGIAVNKGQKDLLNHIDQALVELKENGTYAKIANKWFGDVAGFDYKEASK